MLGRPARLVLVIIVANNCWTAQCFHLIEHPIDGNLLFRVRGRVSATCFIASNSSRRAFGVGVCAKHRAARDTAVRLVR